MTQDSSYIQQSPMTNYSQPIFAHSSITNNSNEYSYTASYPETMNIAQINFNEYSNAAYYSETMNIAPRGLATIDLVNQVLIQAMAIQNQPNQQVLQLNEFRLFYQPPNDNNIYHVTCKLILPDYLENNAFWNDDDYDYEFFYRNSNTRYHVMCKLLSYPLIVNILNKEIYERDFDVNDLNRKYLLTLHQKLNLELNLKQDLPFYLYVPDREMRSDSNGNANIASNMIQTASMVGGLDYFDNVNFNDYIAHQGATRPQQFYFDTSI